MEAKRGPRSGQVRRGFVATSRVRQKPLPWAGAKTDSGPRPQHPGRAWGGASDAGAGRGAGPAPDAPQGRSGRGSGGAVAAATAGEGHGVSASPAGPRRWPGGRDKEEEEEEVSRLRAGEPRGPAGEAGSAAPPLSGARLAGPRGAEFPEGLRRRRRRRGEPGGGAELRAARTARFLGARAALPSLLSAPRPERGTHFSPAR